MVLPRIFSLGLCALSTLTFAAPWQFVKSEDGIVIDKRPHSEGLVEIRAQMQTPTSYSGFLLLLEDSDNVPNWLDNVS
jgi:hypothetical protein